MSELAQQRTFRDEKWHQGASAPFGVSGRSGLKIFLGGAVEKIFERTELKNTSDGAPAPAVPIPPGVNRGLCGYPGKYLPRSAGHLCQRSAGHAAAIPQPVCACEGASFQQSQFHNDSPSDTPVGIDWSPLYARIL